MPIAATDLKLYGSANHAENDTALQGGAIATAVRLEFTDLAVNDSLEAVSSNVADTMNLTLTGRSASGAIVSETKALSGTTVVSFTVLATVERFLKGVLASAAAGTITIRRAATGPTVATMAPGDTTVRRLFYDSASTSTAKTLYEKSFWKNTHATLQLNSAALKLTADPAAVIRIGAAPSVGDAATIANRVTAPATVTFVDDNVSQTVPGGALAAGSGIGVWAEMALAANNAAIKNTFTTELSGTTV